MVFPLLTFYYLVLPKVVGFHQGSFFQLRLWFVQLWLLAPNIPCMHSIRIPTILQQQFHIVGTIFVYLFNDHCLQRVYRGSTQIDEQTILLRGTQFVIRMGQWFLGVCFCVSSHCVWVCCSCCSIFVRFAIVWIWSSRNIVLEFLEVGREYGVCDVGVVNREYYHVSGERWGWKLFFWKTTTSTLHPWYFSIDNYIFS